MKTDDFITEPSSWSALVSRMTCGWIGGALLLLLTFVTFSASLPGDFIWDDLIMVKQNHCVLAANGLRHIWFSTIPMDYFPLTYSSFWVEWRLWDGNPVGFHLVNILLHAGATIIFWRILLRLNIPAAWLVALIFAVHPVNVGSVAWISERKNTLALFFYFLSLLFYLRFEQESRWKWYGFALGMFMLALLSKTSVVMFPCALLLLAWWQRRRISITDIRRSIPFFTLSLAMGLVTMWFQFFRASGGVSANPSGFLTRLAAAGRAIWFYIGKIFLPTDLMAIYPLWKIDEGNFLAYIPALFVLVTLVVFWIKRDTWGRFCLVAFGYFIAMLFPVLGFFTMYYHTLSWVADHFQQLALPGIIALVVGGASSLLAHTSIARSPLPKVLAALVVLVLSVSSYSHCRAYLSHHNLWRDILSKNPACVAATINLGVELSMKGKHVEALPYFTRYPEEPEAQFDWGNTLMNLNQFEESIPHFQKAITLKPNLSMAYSQLGSVYHHLGKIDEALRYYLAAVRLEPLDFRAQNNVADLFLKQGKEEKAMPHVVAAIEADPNRPEPHFNAAKILLLRGEYQNAINCADRALERRRLYPEALVCKAVAFAKLNRHEEAAETCRRAINLKPKYAEAHYNYGNVLLKLKRNDQAESAFREAVKLNPDLPQAHYQLGTLCAGAGRVAEAVSHWKAAVELNPDWPEALNNLAWALATNRDPSVRNGAEAVQFATRLLAAGGDKNPAMLDTLAAALAEAGDFEKAIYCQNQAVQLAQQKSAMMAQQFEFRLQLYQTRRPYRE